MLFIVGLALYLAGEEKVGGTIMIISVVLGVLLSLVQIGAVM